MLCEIEVEASGEKKAENFLSLSTWETRRRRQDDRPELAQEMIEDSVESRRSSFFLSFSLQQPNELLVSIHKLSYQFETETFYSFFSLLVSTPVTTAHKFQFEIRFLLFL